MSKTTEFSTLVMQIRPGETVHIGETQFVIRGTGPRVEIVFVAPRDTKIWRTNKLSVLKTPKEGAH